MTATEGEPATGGLCWDIRIVPKRRFRAANRLACWDSLQIAVAEAARHRDAWIGATFRLPFEARRPAAALRQSRRGISCTDSARRRGRLRQSGATEGVLARTAEVWLLGRRDLGWFRHGYRCGCLGKFGPGGNCSGYRLRRRDRFDYRGCVESLHIHVAGSTLFVGDLGSVDVNCLQATRFLCVREQSALPSS